MGWGEASGQCQMYKEWFKDECKSHKLTQKMLSPDNDTVKS